MKESSLKKITLAGSIIGLVFLYFVSVNIGQDYVKICEIGEKDIGSIITTMGFIDEMNFNKGHIFITLKDETGTIRVVIWNETVNSVGNEFRNKIERGTLLKLRGEVKKYESQIEIIPNKNEIEIMT
ncbi:MAG: OB-fold nucleic acid binding domain-containing protein [Candidatus Aenigmarchaeota archaeon]|nr:OB-fold nucleic acid binding domain-containing protein [Candidatus Aenigmarchaeota archaeon]